MREANRHSIYIVTDSTADIPVVLLPGLPITVVPLTVELSGQIYRDGIDLTREEFLRRLVAGETPRTSQPSVGAFQEVYRDLIDQGYDVVSVHVASTLSGTFNSARTAAQATDPTRVHPFDSGSVSMGFGWLAVEAAEMARAGLGASEIVAHLERRRADVRVWAVLETLEYLQRGGRIGRTAAFLGSALQIKPVVSVHDGDVHPLERVRTFRRALERVLDLAAAEGDWDRVAVLHLGSPDGARMLAERMTQIAPSIEIMQAMIGTVIGTYGGPGVLGIAGLVSSPNSPA